MSNTNVKMKIVDAFCELLAQQPFSLIKVTDIITKAEISHMSFYRNFQDKFDLVEAICYDDFNLFVKIYGKNALWKEIVLCILNAIKNSPSFYRKIFLDDSAMQCTENALARTSQKYTGNKASKCTYASWRIVLQDWARSNFNDSVEDVYWKLITNLPLCEVLSGSDLKRVVDQYERKSMNKFKAE